MDGDDEITRGTALALLGARARGATICPSEIARALAARHGAAPEANAWRGLMPIVHETIDRLVAEGIVRLSWKGERRTARNGPYRIGRNTPQDP